MARKMNNNIYTVKPGDTLYKISKKTGIPVQQLVEFNNISNPDYIQIEQQLSLVPGDDYVYYAGQLPEVTVTAKAPELPGDVYLSDGTVFNYDQLQYMIDTAENKKEKDGAIKVMKKYINKAILEHPDATIFRNIQKDKQMMGYLDNDVKDLLFRGQQHKIFNGVQIERQIPTVLLPIGQQGMKINYLNRYQD